MSSHPHIASIVDKENEMDNGLGEIGCSICEMTVTWAQTQLADNRSAEDIKDYLNDVSIFPLRFRSII